MVISLAAAAGGQATQDATPPDASTPKGALKAFAVALDAGDEARIRSLVDVTSPLEQKMVEAITEMAAATAQWKHAMAARFGAAAAESAMGESPDVLQKSLAAIDAANEKIDGDLALVSVAGLRESHAMKKVSGSWKLSETQIVKDQGLTPQMVDEQMAIVSAQSKMLRDLATEITDGKYPTAVDAAAALRGKMNSSREPTTAPDKK